MDTSPAPISDLATLLATLAPELNAGTWAWCAVDDGVDLAGVADVDLALTMREREGRTAVVAEDVALARGWPVAMRTAWITLRVHSDLAAVGLTAAFARALADEGIACNVVAGVHHDHLFVPVDRAGDALRALRVLQARSAAPR